jgi:hypothetical protein
MRFNHLLFTSLLVASLFLSTPLRSNTHEKCATVTRAKIEERFGIPVKCLNEVQVAVGVDSEDVKCFRHEGVPMRVQFNSSDVVTSIEMSTSCNGLQSLMRVLNETIPKSARGKILQEVQKSPSGSCEVVSEEEYECLRIKYSRELCMGCAPASIKAIWK